jgi:hypothetical protein
MIIKINSNIFNDNQNLKDVNYLLNIFSENRRYDYFCEYGLIKDSPLFNNLLELNKELIEQYFNRFIRESTPKISHTISEETSDTEFNLEEAKIFFNQPLIIILENNLNDAYFIDQLITVFKKRGKGIRRHKKNNWLKYGNGGGCTNITNFIEGEMKNFKDLPKENHKYLKCFVLIDSDKRHPTDVRPERAKLFQYLNEKNIPYHELTKREMENYLPEEIIRTVEKNEDFIDAYLSLTPIQKDYFDIENGFEDKNIDDFDHEIKETYAGLSKEVISVFRKKKMNINNFKTEFPKLFEQATQEQLKKRADNKSNPNELEDILDKITQLL